MRTSAGTDSSSLDMGLASKSQSQDWSSLGEAPRTSISMPQRRAAIVAFQIRGFGRYEKIRSWLMIPPASRSARPELSFTTFRRDYPDETKETSTQGRRGSLLSGRNARNPNIIADGL